MVCDQLEGPESLQLGVAVLRSAARQKDDGGERTGARGQADRARQRGRPAPERDVLLPMLAADAGGKLCDRHDCKHAGHKCSAPRYLP
jgi:hypothetical protein